MIKSNFSISNPRFSDTVVFIYVMLMIMSLQIFSLELPHFEKIQLDASFASCPTPVPFISGKCKRLPHQLVELEITKKITKFAEVIARSKCGIFTEILDITTT